MMWKVGDVAPMTVLGAGGYPMDGTYGFSLTTKRGKPLVSFAYAMRAAAEAAATQVRSAIEQAVEVRPHAQ